MIREVFDDFREVLKGAWRVLGWRTLPMIVLGMIVVPFLLVRLKLDDMHRQKTLK